MRIRPLEADLLAMEDAMKEESEEREAVEDRPDDVPAKHSTSKDPNQSGDSDATVEEASKDSYPASDPPAW